MFLNLIRFACIPVCAVCVLSCALMGGARGHGLVKPATSTYAGRLEAAPKLVRATTVVFERSDAAGRPSVGRSEPHWSELLEPLREFTDDDWRRIRRVQRVVHRAARSEGLSPSLINGVIWVESKFFPHIRGSRGPRGLMQLMPVTARSLARRLNRRYLPNNVDFNVSVGVYYLARMLQRFHGDLHLALAAYNWGPGPIKEWIAEGAESPKPRMPYVSRVYRAAYAFCERLAQESREPRDGPYVCPQLVDPSVGDDAAPRMSSKERPPAKPPSRVTKQDV